MYYSYHCNVCDVDINNPSELEIKRPNNGDQVHVLSVDMNGKHIGEKYLHKKCGSEVKKLISE